MHGLLAKGEGVAHRSTSAAGSDAKAKGKADAAPRVAVPFGVLVAFTDARARACEHAALLAVMRQQQASSKQQQEAAAGNDDARKPALGVRFEEAGSTLADARQRSGWPRQRSSRVHA